MTTARRTLRRSPRRRDRRGRGLRGHRQEVQEADVAHRAQPGHQRGVAEQPGVGIGAEDMPRIGDPFFQARSSYDRRHAGTGLGLSIVKGLLALHGGHIEIASRLGEGTKITIRLPMDCDNAGRRGAAATVGMLVPRPAPQSSQERVKISA